MTALFYLSLNALAATCDSIQEHNTRIWIVSENDQAVCLLAQPVANGFEMLIQKGAETPYRITLTTDHSQSAIEKIRQTPRLGFPPIAEFIALIGDSGIGGAFGLLAILVGQGERAVWQGNERSGWVLAYSRADSRMGFDSSVVVLWGKDGQSRKQERVRVLEKIRPDLLQALQQASIPESTELIGFGTSGTVFRGQSSDSFIFRLPDGQECEFQLTPHQDQVLVQNWKRLTEMFDRKLLPSSPPKDEIAHLVALLVLPVGGIETRFYFGGIERVESVRVSPVWLGFPLEC